MRPLLFLGASALSVAFGVGCGCPRGNLVIPARDVTFDLNLQAAGTQLTGHGSSQPDGEGISFDRATITVGGAETPAPAPSDLVLFAMSPGCHADASGATTCDRIIQILLTVHHVDAGAASFDLDDSRARLALEVAPAVSATGPCPGKDAGAGVMCGSSGAANDWFVPYTGIRGHLTVARLAEDCTDVIAACALAADGTFDVTAASANGDTVELASGTLTAADSFSYRDGNSCNL
jgi:hypothetical protein